MYKTSYVYILFSKPNGTLYTGVTSNLKERIIEHKMKKHQMSFTANYEVTKLGYFEEFTSQRGVEQGGNPLLTSVDCFATLAMTRTTAVLNSLGVRQPSEDP